MEGSEHQLGELLAECVGFCCRQVEDELCPAVLTQDASWGRCAVVLGPGEDRIVIGHGERTADHEWVGSIGIRTRNFGSGAEPLDGVSTLDTQGAEEAVLAG